MCVVFRVLIVIPKAFTPAAFILSQINVFNLQPCFFRDFLGMPMFCYHHLVTDVQIANQSVDTTVFLYL